MKSFMQFMAENTTIGKKMGHDYYVHKDYAHILPQKELNAAKKHLPKDHKYTIIKHNKKEGSFSFIHSPDFDSAHEPTVGHSIKVHSGGALTHVKQKKDPQIYHHKHMFVGPEHKGFDIEKSKERSKHWRDVVGVNKSVSSRIGTKSYWDREVVPKLKNKD